MLRRVDMWLLTLRITKMLTFLAMALNVISNLLRFAITVLNPHCWFLQDQTTCANSPLQLNCEMLSAKL